MIATVLLVAGSLLLLLAIHPFTTYPASLRILARFRPKPVLPQPVAQPMRAAMCVCAYNEEKVIRAKVENMLAMRAAMPGLDLFFYVDGASDRTAEIIGQYADESSNGIRLVASPSRLGKTHGMNTLVAMTDADYVVFSDANVIFAQDALPRLLAGFADPDVGCICGHLVYTRPDDTATAATGSLYWRIEEMIKTYESDTGSVMGADGSIFALRRALHVPPPADLIDDMFVSLSILCRGHRIIRAADAYAYEEAVSRPGEEFRRKVRIACQAFNVHRALWPQLRRLPLLDLYKYISHKLLRWLTIFLIAGAALCLAAGLAMVLVWRSWLSMAVVAGGAAAAMAVTSGGPLARLRDIVDAFVATGIGIVRSLRGERFQTWNPPASSRGVAAE